MEDNDLLIGRFNEAFLLPLVRQASGSRNLHLNGWQVQNISGGRGGGQIERISGMGHAGGQSVRWRLILKTVKGSPTNSTNPQSSNYWKREPLYYKSGLLADLPVGLCAPRCYAIREYEGSYQIFLEDLQDAKSGMDWSVESYWGVARSLGQFNGAYLVGKPIPTAKWIPRQWLRTVVEEAAPNMDLFFHSQDHPILKRAYRTIPIGMMRLAWEQRHDFMEKLEQLPQTFCHQDAFCRNLYSMEAFGINQLAAIDWAYSGQAALGTDLVSLVYAGIFLGPIHVSEVGRLTRLALEGYLQGLDDAGWQGAPELVRFAFNVSVFYRYLIGTIIGDGLEGLINAAAYPIVEQFMGKSIEQVADVLADLNAWSLACFEDALG
jgi:hypothetical protein